MVVGRNVDHLAVASNEVRRNLHLSLESGVPRHPSIRARDVPAGSPRLRTLKYSLNERPSRTTTLPFRPVPARLPLLSDAAMSHKGLPSPTRLWEGWLTILRNSQSSSGPSIPLASARMTISGRFHTLPQIGRIVRQLARSPQFLRDELKIRVRIGCFRIDMRPAMRSITLVPYCVMATMFAALPLGHLSLSVPGSWLRLQSASWARCRSAPSACSSACARPAEARRPSLTSSIK